MNAINNLHPTETLDNWNINWELINLNPEKIELLNYLEKETKISKESYITDLLNEENDWVDYQDLKDCLEREKDTNRVFLSGKEAKDYLKNLYLNDPKNYKSSRENKL